MSEGYSYVAIVLLGKRQKTRGHMYYTWSREMWTAVQTILAHWKVSSAKIVEHDLKNCRLPYVEKITMFVVLISPNFSKLPKIHLPKKI